MNFKRKTKTITVITVILSTILCFCFVAIGAYAAPAKESTEKNTYNTTIDNTDNIYTQSGYFFDSYIFEIGWNLTEKRNQGYYSVYEEITLDDQSTITIYFDNTVKEYANNPVVLDALKNLIYKLNNADPQLIPTKIETPLISRITFVALNELPELAEQYYNEDLIGFSAILLDEMQPEILNDYAEKYYKENNIAGFSILIAHMSEQENKKWLERAKEDKKNTFYAVIKDELFD